MIFPINTSLLGGYFPVQAVYSCPANSAGELTGKLQTKSVLDFVREQNFKAREIPRTPQYTTISYMKSKKDVAKLKRCLGDKYMSNKALGEKTFEYYKEMECPDEE